MNNEKMVCAISVKGLYLDYIDTSNVRIVMSFQNSEERVVKIALRL